MNIRVGRGTAVHTAIVASNGTVVGTRCGSDVRFSVQGAAKTTDAVTCKRCLAAAPKPEPLTWESYLPQGL